MLIANAITAGAMTAFIGRALPGDREPSPEEAWRGLRLARDSGDLLG